MGAPASSSPVTSVLSSIYLYTEGGDAPGWPGAKSDHIGNIRAHSSEVQRALDGMQRRPNVRYIELRTLGSWVAMKAQFDDRHHQENRDCGDGHDAEDPR